MYPNLKVDVQMFSQLNVSELVRGAIFDDETNLSSSATEDQRVDTPYQILSDRISPPLIYSLNYCTLICKPFLQFLFFFLF